MTSHDRDARLRQLLRYDPDSGLFTWLVYRSPHVLAGNIAGNVRRNGYVRIVADNRKFYAHRLAWWFTFGKWPQGEVDHINGDATDNRLANLRDVTGNVNRQNVRRARATNLSGVLGASWMPAKRKWRAQICVNGATRRGCWRTSRFTGSTTGRTRNTCDIRSS